EYDLMNRVDSIRRLKSVDLELLYLLTRYPEWRPDDVVALDEAFRGEKVSPRAAARRARRLKAKALAFGSSGLMQDRPDSYMLAGDEFLQLYLRFLYEVRKYGELSRGLHLGEAPTTPFGEKAHKLVSSLAFETPQAIAVVVFRFSQREGQRTETIAAVRHRFSVLTAALSRQPINVMADKIALMESFELCQLVAKRSPCCLLVISLRNLENPSESLLIEIYFEADQILAFPLAVLTEQAEAAKILVEDFDAWLVTLPTLEELVETTSGHTLDEIMAQADTFERWVIRSIRKHVKESAPPSPEDKKEDENGEALGKWVELYQQGQPEAAVDALTRRLALNPERPIAARCYNDRGYIRYGLKNASEAAKRDLEHALDLHHKSLALTLLNLAVIAIDSGDFARAVEWIEDALLITHGRETIGASFLRLRLLPARLPVGKRERFEQHPANAIEAGYVNLAYAVAREGGYDAAKDLLAEGLEVIPSSVYLRHALARLHLWQQRADLADALYDDMANRPIPSKELAHEIEAYMKIPRGRRKR
ncbi:MAG: tetratricopeptide repeat protein, partial [Candidatus Methylomirabilales bacterium]